ncbi:MAG: tat (twin-arginine translocation) pathway signal sequence [Zoogloeaceae bacterium]|nr:tat (twin-arginine translocation) pathway signal sequence [Zoogloeaceae bacterium]
MTEQPITFDAQDFPRRSRRAFLKNSGVLLGTLWAGSSALMALAPSRSWALEMSTLDEATGRNLLSFCRRIFPHDTLDDAVYALVVKDLDAAAAKSAEVKQMLADGSAALDKAAGGAWLKLTPAAQDKIVAGLAGSPLFKKVHGTAVVSLYNNELAFAHFGYEGNAFNHGGGYLLRGFNDLKWLPDPTPAASPAPFTGA